MAADIGWMLLNVQNDIMLDIGIGGMPYQTNRTSTTRIATLNFVSIFVSFSCDFVFCFAMDNIFVFFFEHNYEICEISESN